MLDSRQRGCEFEPHRRHCVVSLSKNSNPSLVLVQPRKIRPFITERLLMGRKESNQTKTNQCVLGAQKNPLIRTVLLSTHNICFEVRNKKNDFNYTPLSGGLHMCVPIMPTMSSIYLVHYKGLIHCLVWVQHQGFFQQFWEKASDQNWKKK